MGVPLFGQEHVDRYRETDGEESHDWQGTTAFLLTTTGRNFQDDPIVALQVKADHHTARGRVATAEE